MSFEKNSFIKNIQKHHEGQFDSQGAPYWLHPYRVALGTQEILNTLFDQTELEIFADEELRMRVFITALYHDVIEDVEGSFEAVEEELKDFPEVLRSLYLLTKPEEWDHHVLEFLTEEEMDLFNLAETYEEKIQAMISAEDFPSLIVKLADNEDNTLPWRAKTLGKPTTKYARSKIMLAEAIKEFVDAK